ncbi:MAG: cytidylate kinase-like family protein [Clostridia bacterium]|nr:cytidylate kinase-like family protein [Clostridia bacterium]
MKIITVSRQFSSGGRELAKRLADALGFDYYDREIISEIAKRKGLDEGYVESTLSTGSFKAIPLHFAKSFSFAFANTGKSEMMVEEKKVIDEIANRGRDFVIVGRNSDVLLSEYKPLNIFVCANLEYKIARCQEKAPEGSTPTIKDIQKQIKQIDKDRASSRALISATKWGECTNYHLTINSTGWQIKDLVPIAEAFARIYFGEENEQY